MLDVIALTIAVHEVFDHSNTDKGYFFVFFLFRFFTCFVIFLLFFVVFPLFVFFVMIQVRNF